MLSREARLARALAARWGGGEEERASALPECGGPDRERGSSAGMV